MAGEEFEPISKHLLQKIQQFLLQKIADWFNIFTFVETSYLNVDARKF